MAVTGLLERPSMIGGVAKTTLSPDELREWRHSLGWSMRELAERAGVHERTVQNAEHGKQVRESSWSQLIRALDDGEDERAAEEAPDVSTVTYEVQTGRGTLKIVATGDEDSVGRLDLAAAVAKVFDRK